MSKLIIPNGSQIEELTQKAESGDISNKEKKRLRRMQEAASNPDIRAIRVKDLPSLVASIVDPAMGALYHQVRLQYLSAQAVKEVLIKKELITDEEYGEMLEKVLKKVTEKPETPNSPALEEAKEASETGEVKRLDEVPPILTEDCEDAPRRIVEG